MIPPMKLHEDEVATSVDLVRAMLRAQHPQWANLPITPSDERGTDHAIYRVGDALAVRLPTIHWAASQPAKEHRWLNRLGPQFPLELPIPIVLGEPAEGFPYQWIVVPWLDGERATEQAMPDPEPLIEDLAAFTSALQRIDPTKGPAPIDRDRALVYRDEALRAAVEATRGEVDSAAVLASWNQSMSAPEWDGVGVWVHGDLAPGNVLCRNGQLTAVIDWGAACVADPARDALCAWNFYGGDHAAEFRAAMHVDDSTWLRARGFALSGAVESLAYYRHTDPQRVADAHRVLRRIFADR